MPDDQLPAEYRQNSSEIAPKKSNKEALNGDDNNAQTKHTNAVWFRLQDKKRFSTIFFFFRMKNGDCRPLILHTNFVRVIQLIWFFQPILTMKKWFFWKKFQFLFIVLVRYWPLGNFAPDNVYQHASIYIQVKKKSINLEFFFSHTPLQLFFFCCAFNTYQ